VSSSSYLTRFLRAWHIARGAGWDLRLRWKATRHLMKNLRG
jgi:hypothetical protein